MIIVRAAVLDDLKYLPEIYFESFGKTSSEETFLFHFNLAGRYILVAQLDGLIIGFIRGYVEETDGYAYVSSLAVSPQFRQRGVGRQLLDDLLAILFQNPAIQSVELRVTPFNVKAILLYRRNGFIAVDPVDSLDQNYVGMKLHRSAWLSNLSHRAVDERE